MRRPPPRKAGRRLFVLPRRIWRRPISWRGNEKASLPAKRGGGCSFCHGGYGGVLFPGGEMRGPLPAKRGGRLFVLPRRIWRHRVSGGRVGAHIVRPPSCECVPAFAGGHGGVVFPGDRQGRTLCARRPVNASRPLRADKEASCFRGAGRGAHCAPAVLWMCPGLRGRTMSAPTGNERPRRASGGAFDHFWSLEKAPEFMLRPNSPGSSSPV